MAIFCWLPSALAGQHQPVIPAALPRVTLAIQESHFADPLIKTAPTTSAEDDLLLKALATYRSRKDPDDQTALAAFISEHPNSGWDASIETNLGLSYLHDGYFSKAIAAWQQAWLLGKSATDPHAHALVDRDIGELASTYGALGDFKDLSTLFTEIGNRPITGSATEQIQSAREELTLVKRDPRHLYNCGPTALMYLMLQENPKDQRGSNLVWYNAGPDGTNFSQLEQMGAKIGFANRVVFRKPGQPVPVPAIINWKLGHFAAIVGQENGRYHIEDPQFPGLGLWVTSGALDTESSGYFLIPGNMPINKNWRLATNAEASSIWGKGPTYGSQAGAAGDPDANPPNNCPMCGYNIKESSVSLSLSDTPVGYSPPIGPSAKTTISYNQREDSQPANFDFYNVGQKWTLNWITYVTDDPTNPGGSVSRFLPGGGAYYYTGYNSSTGQFALESDDQSILVLTSESPVTYKRLLRDGSVDIYAQSDGSTAYPRNIFLSQVIDPQGNAITLNYDGQQRLTSVTDAAGRQTTFAYNQPAQPLLVTQVTDPFGRTAVMTYDPYGRLTSITDILGITSSFTYDANALVNSMTTPYGTTSFAYTAPGSGGPPRFLDVTDPLGYHEREEWIEPAPGIPDSDPANTVPQGMPVAPVNQYLEYRDSFHWDKNAYVVAGCTVSGGCDYTKARDTHFLHVANTDIKSTTVESIKYPLENRIWYNYPGQNVSSIYTGTSNQPIATGRVLDDGTTQISQTAYDAGFYNPTQSIDPLGRTTSYTYANQIDLSAISQTTAYGLQTTLAQFLYNTHHLPIFSSDAAGQTTSYTYNTAGQLTSTTNALDQATTYHYNSTGDLTSITNANNVTAATYTYDAFDRVATYTDSEGWVVAFNYDAANRITKINYPDGTADTYTYDKLDLASYKDRIGRMWSYSHDADRRLTEMTDPTGQQTLYGYNDAGKPTSLTDPKGNITQWAYDVEDRVTTKTYADNSILTYTYENTTSRLKSVTDALNQTKQYSYAEDNAPSGITYLNAVNATPNVTFAYDPYFQRLTSMTDGTGTTQFSYVPAGTFGALKIQQETTPLASGTITYAYDALGRVASRTITGSGAESFQYDALGRLTNDTNDLGTFTLAYLGQTSQLASSSLAGSSLAMTLSYLPNSGDRRLSGISTAGLSSGQYSTFQYTTNAEDQITGTTQTSDASVSYPATSEQTASFNNLNQVTALEDPPPSSQAYTYDADGNLLSDGTRDYTWDAEKRLIGITYPGQTGMATSFAYDGMNRRTTITDTSVGGGTPVATSYIWCGFKPCQARNSSDAITRAYYEEGEFVPGSPATSYYYGPDNLGSVRRVFSAGSAPAYDYDPYGNPLQTTAPVTDFGYADMFIHQPSGINLTLNRAYDAYSGRWLSRDPAGEAGGINLYGYVEQNPVNLIDSYGLWEFSASGGFGVGGEINFGSNNGQWNFGAHFGLGAGASASINPNPSECHSSGFNGGIAAKGQIGLGSGIEADAGYSPSAPSDSSVEISVAVPGTSTGVSLGEEGGKLTAGGSAQFGEAGSVSSNGEGTVGESAFAGIGGTVYGSNCGCSQ